MCKRVRVSTRGPARRGAARVCSAVVHRVKRAHMRPGQKELGTGQCGVGGGRARTIWHTRRGAVLCLEVIAGN